MLTFPVAPMKATLGSLPAAVLTVLWLGYFHQGRLESELLQVKGRVDEDAHFFKNADASLANCMTLRRRSSAHNC